MMCEQSRADQLVLDIQAAEAAGFDFSVISGHYQPWLSSQGHSPYAWSALQRRVGAPVGTRSSGRSHDTQAKFAAWAESELLPALRSL
jgi:hypothetical protein